MSSLPYVRWLMRASLRDLAVPRPRDLAMAAIVVLAVVILYVEKTQIQHALEIPDCALLRFANASGGGWPLTVFGVLLFLVGRISKNERAEHAALALGVAGVVCFVFVNVGQFVFAEARPREGGAMHFFGLHGHGVSGHANAASLLLFPIRDLLVRPRRSLVRALITIALVLWAIFIAWSRVAMGMHHAWNVVLGSASGFYVSRIVTADAVRAPRA